jgi:hypothetical protein
MQRMANRIIIPEVTLFEAPNLTFRRNHFQEEFIEQYQENKFRRMKNMQTSEKFWPNF